MGNFQKKILCMSFENNNFLIIQNHQNKGALIFGISLQQRTKTKFFKQFEYVRNQDIFKENYYVNIIQLLAIM